ncbi:hypothetical protein [uncultured Shewanella sp.]|uniref:hypothetical protein n=1 Tax=uncultured Shewanella sp. TaxID=173975 RepID=UPI00262B3AD5|nr:hypothetical protein [uncultured Shewanella sp.]
MNIQTLQHVKEWLSLLHRKSITDIQINDEDLTFRMDLYQDKSTFIVQMWEMSITKGISIRYLTLLYCYPLSRQQRAVLDRDNTMGRLPRETNFDTEYVLEEIGPHGEIRFHHNIELKNEQVKSELNQLLVDWSIANRMTLLNFNLDDG